MQTVKQEYFCETEVNRSKFLTFIMPDTHYERRLEELKEAHPKARHYVVAYRRMNEFNQIQEYGSDDGEPKGCAGKPTLNVLRGHDLINCATITVRYFGGIKLGTGGMVRAYSLAAKNVIDAAQLHTFEIKSTLKIGYSYSNGNQVDYFLERHSIEVLSKTYLEHSVEAEIRVTSEEKSQVLAYAQESQQITLS